MAIRIFAVRGLTDGVMLVSHGTRRGIIRALRPDERVSGEGVLEVSASTLEALLTMSPHKPTMTAEEAVLLLEHAFNPKF